jgi:hypothetical protein
VFGRSNEAFGKNKDRYIENQADDTSCNHSFEGESGKRKRTHS